MSSNLQRGIELVGLAIRLDSEAKLSDAVNMYQQALSFLEAAFMEESDLNRKNQILDKMREYNERMQLLNDTLQATQPPRAPEASATSGASQFSATNFPQESQGGKANISYSQPQQSIQSPYEQQMGTATPQSSLSPQGSFQAPQQNIENPYSSFGGQQGPQQGQQVQQSPQSSFQAPQQTMQAPYSQEPPPYDSFSSQTPQSPYGSQNQSQYANQGISSPYGNSSQPSVSRAPYDSSTSSPAPYSMQQTPPYDQKPSQSSQMPNQPPPVSRPPPVDVWGDSLQNQQNSSYNTPAPDMSRFNEQQTPNQQNQAPHASFSPPSSSPYSSFQVQSPVDNNRPIFNENQMPQMNAAQNPQTTPQYPSGYSTDTRNTSNQEINGSFSNFSAMQNALPKPTQNAPQQPPQQQNQQNKQNYQQINPGTLQRTTGEAEQNKYNSFIVRLLQEHPRSIPNIQIALLVAEEAKKADRGTQYQDALDLYTEALERFILVFNRETNQKIKQTLHNTINAYMQRAEKIKDVCKIIPRRVPDTTPTPSTSTSQRASNFGNSVVQQNQEPTTRQQPAQQTVQPSMQQHIQPSMQRLASQYTSSGNNSTQLPASHSPSPIPQNYRQQSQGSLLQDSSPNSASGRGEQRQASYEGKPIQITNETKSLLARQRLRVTVSIQNNLVFPGDKLNISVKVENRSTMVVQMLKVTLRRIERNQKYDAKGRQVMATDALKIHKQEFYQGSIFPLPAESNYSGELLYTIPHGLKPTNVAQRGVFEREYDLSIQCVLSMRKNLSVRFPVVVGPS